MFSKKSLLLALLCSSASALPRYLQATDAPTSGEADTGPVGETGVDGQTSNAASEAGLDTSNSLSDDIFQQGPLKFEGVNLEADMPCYVDSAALTAAEAAAGLEIVAMGPGSMCTDDGSNMVTCNMDLTTLEAMAAYESACTEAGGTLHDMNTQIQCTDGTTTFDMSTKDKVCITAECTDAEKETLQGDYEAIQMTAMAPDGTTCTKEISGAVAAKSFLAATFAAVIVTLTMF